MSRTDWSAVCIHCVPGQRCDEHRIHRKTPPQDVRKVLRLVCVNLEELLESHRWARLFNKRGPDTQPRLFNKRGPDTQLYCLDCWMTIEWDPKKEKDPTMGQIVRCPGKIVVAKVPETTIKPFGLETSGAVGQIAVDGQTSTLTPRGGGSEDPRTFSSCSGCAAKCRLKRGHRGGCLIVDQKNG